MERLLNLFKAMVINIWEVNAEKERHGLNMTVLFQLTAFAGCIT